MFKLQQLIIANTMIKTGPAKINKDTTKIPTAKLSPNFISARQSYVEFYPNNCPDKRNQ